MICDEPPSVPILLSLPFAQWKRADPRKDRPLKIDRIRCGQRITLRLDGFVSFFAGANAYGLLYG